jgi:hypothetical protein
MPSAIVFVAVDFPVGVIQFSVDQNRHKIVVLNQRSRD